MVEVCRNGESAAHGVGCGEVHVQGLGSACRLRVVAFDAADKGLVVHEREVSVDGQIVAESCLFVLYLQERVEAYYFVSGSDGYAFLRRFHHLSGSGVQGNSALVAVFRR